MSEHMHAVRDQGLIVTCEQGHQQTLYLPDHSETEARMLGGLMDGTSEWFRSKPRDNPIPGSPLARCGHCGAWISCEVFGYV